MSVVGIGEEENRFLEFLNLIVHLVGLDVRLELGQVVDGTLAMSSSNDICRVMSNVSSDFAPGCLNGGDRVSEGTVL